MPLKSCSLYLHNCLNSPPAYGHGATRAALKACIHLPSHLFLSEDWTVEDCSGGGWESVSMCHGVAELSFWLMPQLIRHLSVHHMTVSSFVVQGQGNVYHPESCGEQSILQNAPSPSEACQETTSDKARSKVLVNLVCN